MSKSAFKVGQIWLDKHLYIVTRSWKDEAYTNEMLYDIMYLDDLEAMHGVYMDYCIQDTLVVDV
jgi:hypothetical protein